MGASAIVPDRLSPATRMGAVTLTVSDLARARDYYEDALGLRADPRSDDTIALSAGDGPPLIVLRGDPGAPARSPRAPGLFHVALLLPGRGELGRALRRLADVGAPLTGASDHLVSEALYLRDPEGNGIELYRDRPRDGWPHDDVGELRMATLALDLPALLADAGEETAPGEAQMPAATTVGHVHLQVADIPRAEAFYVGLIGLEPTVRSYPGALFVAAGGYHHHVGLNTWNSAGAPPAPAGALGLREFELVVGSEEELERLRRRLVDAGVTVESTDADGAPAAPGALRVDDPFANALLVRAA